MFLACFITANYTSECMVYQDTYLYVLTSYQQSVISDQSTVAAPDSPGYVRCTQQDKNLLDSRWSRG